MICLAESSEVEVFKIAETGLSMLFISHDLGVISEICDRVLVMHQGKVVEEGPVEQVLRNPVVEDALALDHLMLLGVEGGRIVLEVLDQGARLGALKQNLRFAFVNLLATGHYGPP